MKTGLFITDAIIIAIVALPFILILSNSKKKERKLSKALKAEVLKDKGKLSNSTVHNNFALGIDNSRQRLYFYKVTKEAAYTQIVDLKTMASCQVDKKTRYVRDKEKKQEIIERLLLILTHKDQNNVTNFEFYDNNDAMPLSGEIDIAHQWQSIITQFLDSNAEMKPKHMPIGESLVNDY